MFDNRNRNRNRTKARGVRNLTHAVLTLATVVLALGTASAQDVAFSLDAGSDLEISDPNADGDEWLDPGDAYLASMVLTGSQDGAVDDFFFLGVDAAPSAAPAAGAIPFGTGCTGAPSGCFGGYFDLDGMDAINADLLSFIDPESPVNSPIAKTSFTYNEQVCINDVQYVQVSFDDDNAASWIGGAAAAPTNTTSPGANTFGSTSAADEIVALTLSAAGSGSSTSHTVTSRSGLASESTVNAILAPNPVTQAQDDDIDALDVIGDAENCPIFFYSPDHEADYGLERGGIYQYDTTGAGTGTLAIQASVHFGLRPTVDIDAFEFVWMDDSSGNPALAVLFSVDDDDGNTLANERGALSPGMIYGSFLDGSYFAVARVAWVEDVDAISVSSSPSSDLFNTNP
jgi:hypothetical protein